MYPGHDATPAPLSLPLPAEALKACAEEAIRTPGAVQAFGMVAAVGDDLRILRAGGCGALGEPSALVGRNLAEVLPAEIVARLRGGAADDRPRRVGRFAAGGRPFDLTYHRAGGCGLLELTPVVPPAVSAGACADAAHALVGRLETDEPFCDFAEATADEMRRATGYDRVMVYRFDADWHGEVIAEARAADLEPYLGLRYPASDIPPQARAMYAEARLRVLEDAEADPVPLEPRPDPAAGREVDLTHAVCRAMSPVHREYLRNMGGRGTLVASVLVRGRLWGLLACHHRLPRLPAAEERDLAATAARLLTARAAAAEERDRALAVEAARQALHWLAEHLSGEKDVVAGLVDPRTGLRELLRASGLAVVRGNAVRWSGTVPGAADLVRLADWLEAQGERIYATALLPAAAPEFAALAPVASGVLATRLAGEPPGWLMWIRPERSATVTWAGDPRKGLTRDEAGPRLTPRKSFAAWVEEVRGTSEPWTPAEVALLTEAVRPNLTEVLLEASNARARRALADLRLMEAVVRTARDAVLVTEAEPLDEPGPRILYANPALLAETGYTLAEVVGRSPRMFQGPATDAAALAHIRGHLRRWEPVTAEVLNYRKDGSTFWAELSITPLAEDHGWVTHWIAVQRNVTARKQAEAALREGEERYRLLFESNPHPMFVYDLETLAFLAANDAAVAKYGWSRDEFRRMTIKDIRPPEDVPALLANVAGVTEGLDDAGVWRHLLRDGRVIRVRIVGHTLTFAGRRAEVVLAQDVTEQLAAEEALREEKRFLRRVIDTVPGFVCVKDELGRFVLANRALADAYGTTTDDILGKTDADFSPTPEEAEGFRAVEERVMRTGLPVVSEEAITDADGGVRFLSTAKHPLPAADGRVHVLAVATDVTTRKRAEAALADREATLSLMVRSMPVGCITKDRDFRITSWNPACEAIFGWSAEEVIGRDPLDLYVPAEHHDLVRGYRARLVTGHAQVQGANTNVTKDGRVIVCEWHGVPLIGPGGEAVGYLSMAQDVTRLFETTDKLRRSEEMYRTLADSINDVVCVHERDGRFSFVSPSVERMTGFRPEDFIGLDFTTGTHPDDIPVARRYLEAAMAGRPAQEQWRFRRRDGHYIVIEANASPVRVGGEIIRFICCSRDITARREAEESLRRAQKLDALGRLAGGVAHDFNNLLTVVIGCGELLRAELPARSRGRAMLEDILFAGSRGAELTRQLLAFGRSQPGQVRRFELSVSLHACRPLLTRLVGPRVELYLDPHEAGWVEADPVQLEQAVMNLVVNARDAMPSGGHLTVRTDRAGFVGDHPDRPAACPPGEYAVLTVSDTGCGMSPEVVARLFEPFFTTKPVGQGTGLGLAVVHGVVAQAGGFLAVRTAPGGGTTFEIYLPSVAPAAAEPSRHVVPAAAARGEVVLVVEDEPAVRALNVTVLTMQGYAVTAAAAGDEALRVFAEMPRRPDLLLTDVVMPGVGGAELARRLAAEHPPLRVLFLSGYTADSALGDEARLPRRHFLRKPYNPADLAVAVRAALDAD